MEEVQGKRGEQPKNQENTFVDEVMKEVTEGEREEDKVRNEVEEVEGDAGGVEVFLGQRFSKRLLPRNDLLVRRGSKSWCLPSRKRLREEVGICSTNTWS